MALPYNPLSVRLQPDDLRSAELLTDLYQVHDDAVEHLEREHVVRGKDRGRHDVITVCTAVCRLDLLSISQNLGRLPRSDDLRVEFARGFAEVPRLVVGRHPFFAHDSAVFVEWKIADPRAESDRAIMMPMITPVWDPDVGFGWPPLPIAKSVARRGAMWIGNIVTSSGNTLPLASHFEGLHGLTMAVWIAPP